MAININKNTTHATTVELVKKMRNHAEVEVLIVDGIEMGIMGYVNPKDKEAGLKAIQDIVDASDKRGMELVMEIMKVSMAAAKQAENGIERNDTLDEIIIDGKKFQISYHQKTIYTNDGATKIDSVDYDIPNEVLKDILTDKAKIWMSENQNN